MVITELPHNIKPLYRLIDASDIDELEDKVSEFLRENSTHSTGIVAGPQLIIEPDDTYWVQAVVAWED